MGMVAMKVSVILAHPNRHSFNHAIAAAVIDALRDRRHDILFHDLYAEGFDPTLPSEELEMDVQLPREIGTHCKEIAECDGIVVVHPNWWGQPPAILKGWVDRVLRPGLAFRFCDGDAGEGVPIGLLKAKTAIVFNTSNTSIKRELELFGDPLESLWKSCIFGLCGVETVVRRMFEVVVTSTVEERRRWLREVQDTVESNLRPSCL
jgi:putative NADPH-quinone reductase